MPIREASTTIAVLALGAVIAGCQSAPAHYADVGWNATYSAAATGAGAMRATGVGLYNGAGTAFRAPFHDLNLMQDQIAPVLLRAESHPYDLTGVTTCTDVLNRVSELDLALGPDVDTPKPKRRTRSARGADFAASAALDAAGSAAEHFIPMRGTIRQLSGAKRYDNHVLHATLAGETRRSFLKAVGMSHSCTWPAAPLDFKPAQATAADAPWSAPLSPPVPVAGSVRLASLGAAGKPSGSRLAVVSPVYVTSAPMAISAPGRLPIPTAVATADPAQAWRPAPRSGLVQVSAPVGGEAVAVGGVAAPWDGAAAFGPGAAARP